MPAGGNIRDHLLRVDEYMNRIDRLGPIDPDAFRISAYLATLGTEFSTAIQNVLVYTQANGFDVDFARTALASARDQMAKEHSRDQGNTDTALAMREPRREKNRPNRSPPPPGSKISHCSNCGKW